MMHTPSQISKHFREVYFGGNWTWSNLRDQLKEVDWQMANKQVENLNTIVTLVFHMHYYVRTITKVLQGGPLEGSDKDSFSHPAVNSQEEWEAHLQQFWTEAEVLAQLIAQLPEEKLGEAFYAEKYGIYYRNLHGLIEHTHYHLGQIAVIRKLLSTGKW